MLKTSKYLSSSLVLKLNTSFGALTSSAIAFQIRPWEVDCVDSINLMDSSGSPVYIFLNTFSTSRALPKKNILSSEPWLDDRGRQCYEALFLARLLVDSGFSDTEQKMPIKLDRMGRLLILVDHEMDLYNLRQLKFLEWYSKKKLLPCYFNYVTDTSNLFFINRSSAYKNLENTTFSICYIFSVNIRLECVVLHTRLRAALLSKNIQFFGFNLYFKQLNDISFCNLNSQVFLNIIKQKDFIFSRLLLKNSSVIIFGQSLATRINNLINIIDLLKQKLSHCLFYYVTLSCNSMGAFYNSMIPINNRFISYFDTVICVHLMDSINIRRFLHKHNSVLWLSSHFSPIISAFKQIQPVAAANFLESGGFYFSNEEKIVSYDCSSPLDLLNITVDSFFNSFKTKARLLISNTCFSFLSTIKCDKIFTVYQNAKNSDILKKEDLAFVKGFQNIWQYNNQDLEPIIFCYFLSNLNSLPTIKNSNYPLKSVAENFYESNTTVLNSSTLAQSSRLNQQFFTL